MRVSAQASAFANLAKGSQKLARYECNYSQKQRAHLFGAERVQRPCTPKTIDSVGLRIPIENHSCKAVLPTK